MPSGVQSFGGVKGAQDIIEASQCDSHTLSNLMNSMRGQQRKLETVVEGVEDLQESDVRATLRGSKVFEGVTLYIIDVQRDGHAWTVERRFNDFVSLDERLSDDIPCKLPAKGRFGLRKKLNLRSFMERRFECLSEYLQHVACHNTGMGSSFMYIDTFLGLSRHSISFDHSNAKTVESIAASSYDKESDDDEMTMIDLEVSSFNSSFGK